MSTATLTFSALGRAVWDETAEFVPETVGAARAFSALGRAVWDETSASVGDLLAPFSFSALGRAVWDETAGCETTR